MTQREPFEVGSQEEADRLNAHGPFCGCNGSVVLAVARSGARERMEEARIAAPKMAAIMTQLVVDNPGQFALVGAASLVASRAAFNLIRPRGAIEALALFALLEIGMPFAFKAAIDRGWITFRIRDADGQLVPFRPDAAAA